MSRASSFVVGTASPNGATRRATAVEGVRLQPDRPVTAALFRDRAVGKWRRGAGAVSAEADLSRAEYRT